MKITFGSNEIELGDLQIIVGAVVAIIGTLGAFFYKFRKKWTLTKKKALDFHPYLSPSDVEYSLKYYIDPHYQSISPGSESELRQSRIVEAQEKLIPKILGIFSASGNKYRHFVILGDSGMGKTTLLINLRVKYEMQNWRKESFLTTYIPLGAEDCNEKINDIINEGLASSTILLLDALDEDSNAINDYSARINELVQLTKNFRFVIMTCRTQFFPSVAVEPGRIKLRSYGEQGDLEFRKFYLSPFSDEEVQRYLKKRFKFRRSKRKLARKIVEKSPTLMVRPMLLSYIESLVDSDEEFTYTYEIYETLIEKWIEREAMKIPVDRDRSKFMFNLKSFTRKIADFLFDDFLQNGKLEIANGKMESFAADFDVELSRIEMQSKSLLNRKPGGFYKFSHKSILEYLIALSALDSEDEKYDFMDLGFTQAAAFLSELYLSKVALPAVKEKKIEIASIAFRKAEINGDRMKTSVVSDQLESSSKTISSLIRLTSLENKVDYISSGMRVVGYEFKDLNPLRPFIHLEGLHFLGDSGLNLNSLKGIDSLNSLRELRIDESRLEDLSKIEKCYSLEILSLPKGQLKSLEQLGDTQKYLWEVDFSNNDFSFSSAFSEFVNLVKLNVSNNYLTEVEAFSSLVELKFLDISNNVEIQDLAPIFELSNLEYLNIENLVKVPDNQVYKMKLFRKNLEVNGWEFESAKIPFLEKIDLVFSEISKANLEPVTGDSFEFRNEFIAQRADFGFSFCALFEYCFLITKKEKKTGDRKKDVNLVLQTSIIPEQRDIVMELLQELSVTYNTDGYERGTSLGAVKELRIIYGIYEREESESMSSLEKHWAASVFGKYNISVLLNWDIFRIEIN